MDKYTILCTELRGSAQSLNGKIEQFQKKADKLQKAINKVTRGDYKASDLSSAYTAQSALTGSITRLGEICSAMNTAALQFSEASAELAGYDAPGEAVLTSGTSVSEYIAGVQLSREQIRAKNKETLMELIGSDQIPDAEKQVAVQSMIRLTEIAEKEHAAEMLLQAKGFLDPVVSITENQVDVVVNALTLSDPERAQIEDIVKRKTEIGAEGIVITLMDLVQ